MQDEENRGVRLNRMLSGAGVCSRREADRMIEAGRVTVDGRAGQTGQRVLPGQTVCVDGVPVRMQEKTILLAVNKPRGVVCTTDRRWGDRTLEDVVDYPERVFGIGRLDKESEGLILMTNRGDLTNRILKSAGGHEREYLVTVDRPVTKEFLSGMEKGVYLKDLGRTTLPCTARAEGKRSFRIILRQGLNRQIRRMCAAFGYQVERLVRVRIMNIALGDLAPGRYRELTPEETRKLLEELGEKDHQG